MANDISVKRQSKNSVFVKLFQDKRYVLQMYKELHPEATDVTVDDITIQTLESVIINTIYNDLGFLVRDRLIMLIEAQSTWNPNIAIRMLFYIAETFRRYINSTEQSEHSSVKIQLPKPELYVIYSGDGEKPDVVSLNEEFFGGMADLEVKVNVLNKVDTTLSGQYIGFCRVFDEQYRLYKDNVKGAKETYRICIEKGYLADFMKEHEKEVIDMMSELFDEEVLRKQYEIAERRRALNEGMAIGEKRGMAIGEKRGIAIGEEQGKLFKSIAIVKKLMVEKGFAFEDALDFADIDKETFEKYSGSAFNVS